MRKYLEQSFAIKSDEIDVQNYRWGHQLIFQSDFFSRYTISIQTPRLVWKIFIIGLICAFFILVDSINWYEIALVPEKTHSDLLSSARTTFTKESCYSISWSICFAYISAQLQDLHIGDRPREYTNNNKRTKSEKKTPRKFCLVHFLFAQFPLFEDDICIIETVIIVF